MQRHNKTSIEPYLAESNKSATSLVFSAEEVIHVQHRRVHEVFYYGLLNRPLVFLRQMKSAAAEAWNRVTYDTGIYIRFSDQNSTSSPARRCSASSFILASDVRFDWVGAKCAFDALAPRRPRRC